MGLLNLYGGDMKKLSPILKYKESHVDRIIKYPIIDSCNLPPPNSMEWVIKAADVVYRLSGSVTASTMGQILSNKYTPKGDKLEEIIKLHKLMSGIFIDKFEMYSEHEAEYIERMYDECERTIPGFKGYTDRISHRITDTDIFYISNYDMSGRIEDEIYKSIDYWLNSKDLYMDSECKFFLCVESVITKFLRSEKALESGYILLTRQDGISCFNEMKYEVGGGE